MISIKQLFIDHIDNSFNLSHTATVQHTFVVYHYELTLYTQITT